MQGDLLSKHLLDVVIAAVHGLYVRTYIRHIAREIVHGYTSTMCYGAIAGFGVATYDFVRIELRKVCVSQFQESL